MAELSPKGELRELLLKLFPSNDCLKAFIEDHYSPLQQSIEFERPPDVTAQQTVVALGSQGYINNEFFDLLVKEQGGPANLPEIQKVRNNWFPGSAAGVDPVETPRVADRPFVNRKEVRRIPRIWWKVVPICWTDDDPKAALQIFSNAYPEKDRLVHLAQTVGMQRADINTDGTPRDVARRIIELAASSALLGNLFEEALADPTIAAYHEQINSVAAGLERQISSARLSRRGAKDIGDGSFLVSLGANIESAQGATPTEGLQSIVEARHGLGDPIHFLAGIANAMRRTAMIEIDGQPAGTGCLVGERHLLTNAHVVRALGGPPPPDLALTAVFDFYAGGLASHIEHGRRVCGRVVTWSLPTATEIRGESSDWNAPNGYLDYALVKMDERVGAEPGGPSSLVGLQNESSRGYFQLIHGAYDFGQASLLIVTQHPLGERLVLSRATPEFEVNANKTRVRYNANTLPGSSGSSVIDDRGRLVALHHFAAKGKNQGVPVNAIAADLKEKKFSRLVSDS